MIRGEASEEEIDSLEEASALRDVSHMPGAREVCHARLAHAARSVGEKTPS